ncbi:MAG: hypothetical protein U0325_22790 [Polyangiales bacterium]
MPKTAARAVTPPPAPAARLICGRAFQVTHAPEGISSEVTAALQAIAKAARSKQPERWGVFPVHGRDVVVVGFASGATPRAHDMVWFVEPGGVGSRHHDVNAYACWPGNAVGPQRADRVDADCVDDFARALAATPAWQRLGATPLDARTLPGGEALEDDFEPQFLLLTDDGRGADVVLGMSFWRAGDGYAQGRVRTWTRAVGDGEVVRVVGVCAARVDRETPLRVAPPHRGPAADDWRDAARQETRAVLDSPRPFAWYFIADPAD